MKPKDWKLYVAIGLFLSALWVGFTDRCLVIPGPRWFGIAVGLVLGVAVAGTFLVLLLSHYGML